jgi:hypothetical protein
MCALNYIEVDYRSEKLEGVCSCLWATLYTICEDYLSGNIMRIPIVNFFGPGLSMLIWGSVQITVGWATARFGLFGLREQIPINIFMNYAGVALTLIR